MRSSNTRGDGPQRQASQSARPPPSKARTSCCCIPGLRMPSVFNIIRGSVYAAVLAWTIICLAIAVHFQSLLQASDLTRFVPFAIFVCSASLLLVIALLGFGFWKDRNPISTRIELGCLGLLGVLWLALGGFLASSDSGDSDVECFANADTQEPMEMPGFNTDTFQAQYRVLEAFTFFNVILILGFLLMLLFLSIRHHRWGNTHVWVSSVTAYPWFGGRDAQTGKLPAPVSAKRSVSQRAAPPPVRSQSTRQAGAAGNYNDERRGRSEEKRLPPAPAKRPSQRSQQSQQSKQSQRRPPEVRRGEPTRNEEGTYVYWIPHTPPEKSARPSGRDRADARPARDKYFRDASPRR